MNQRLLWVGMAVVVLVVFDLETMAYLAPLAVVVVGATVGLVVLWLKVVLDSLRRRRNVS